MSDPLKLALAQAIDELRVPQFDFASVVRRARAAKVPAHKSRRRSVWLALLVFAVPAMAVGAAILPSPQIRSELARYFHLQPGVPVTWQRQTEIAQSQARKRAAFDLRLPSGLPDGTRLARLFQNGSTGTSYTAQYVLRDQKPVSFSIDKMRPHARYLGWIVAFDLDATGHLKGGRKVPVRIWIAGDEVVTIASGALAPAQISRVERAMGGHDAPLVQPAHTQR